jgi:hypothetical protein
VSFAAKTLYAASQRVVAVVIVVVAAAAAAAAYFVIDSIRKLLNTSSYMHMLDPFSYSGQSEVRKILSNFTI